jgi:2-polyprenyl-3-methyl-5-hydroxy-6-metoxy-1,4-benzoquinol methylase
MEIVNLPQSVYGRGERTDVLPFLPAYARSALDVGCGSGGFGVVLRRAFGDGARIVAVEAVPEQAAIAREGHGFDEVIDGYFPDALDGTPETFDLVTFNDVLEHMFDPEKALRKTRRLLRPGGRVVAAIPNVQYSPVILRLLGGRWDYTDIGVLDRTHVRFFTRQTMIEMFDRAGYRVESCAGLNSLRKRWREEPRVCKRIAKLVLGLVPGNFSYVHFVIVATADTATAVR